MTKPKNRQQPHPGSKTPAASAPTDAELQQLVTLYQQNQPATEQLARSLITKFPHHGFAWKVLGVVLQQQGRLDEALAAKQKAADLLPMDATAHSNLANALLEKGRLSEAEASCRKALALAPQIAAAHNNLGLTLLKLERPAEAEASFRAMLVIDPAFDMGQVNLGNALRAQGRLNDAEACYREALNSKHGRIDAYINLGVVLTEQHRLKEAENIFAKVLAVDPDIINSRNNLALNLAIILQAQQQYSEAEKYYRLASKAEPDDDKAHSNLANLYMSQRRFTEAVDSYKAAISKNPKNAYTFGQYNYMRRMLCEWRTEIEDNDRVLNHIVQESTPPVVPFGLLALHEINAQVQLRAARTQAEYWYRPQLSASPLVTQITDRHQRLRIGYLSADLHNHATVYLLAGVLENRTTESCETYLYSYGPVHSDTGRSRMLEACELFREVRELSDEAIAQQIVEDEIDILVDLKGYTQEGRLAITALRPAPVIISWLGYPGTLGHPRLADYIIGDPVVTPLADAAHFSETLALMPHCYQPNDRTRALGDCPSREAAGLPPTGLVFCCFNQSYKITPDVFTLWCRLLAAVPESVLWLLSSHAVAQENLRREAQLRGIDPARLIFASRVPQAEHLARLQLADLALDTFPYTSHTTASDVLWAGVPLATRCGETFASRVAASILQAMDLPELVASTDEAYLALLLQLAQDTEHLARLRRKVADNRLRTPLFDTQRFARDLERLYQTIWAQELAGERKPVVLPAEAPAGKTMPKNASAAKINKPAKPVKPVPKPASLLNMLQPKRLTSVVDIGANPIDGDPPYKPMLQAGLCHVTGFEPQEQALAALLAKKGANERYLPYAVGDGQVHTLHICQASGMTSLYEPDPATLDLFAELKPAGQVSRCVDVATRKLDEIDEIEHVDFLKIDIQGAELSVFANGSKKLASAVAIQTEVSFITLYKNQPAFGEIDTELRRQGFIPHCFAAVKKWPIAPNLIHGEPRLPPSQLLEADMVYVRDFSKPDLLSDEQLKHMALIAHHCYGSSDLALHCVMLLEARQALPTGSQQHYLSLASR